MQLLKYEVYFIIEKYTKIFYRKRKLCESYCSIVLKSIKEKGSSYHTCICKCMYIYGCMYIIFETEEK